MSRFVRRLISAGLGAALFMLLLMPVGAQASTSKVDPAIAAHLARALAKAPAGVTHWTIVTSTMTVSTLSGTVGKEGAGVLTSTVYGNCGSSWMAIGNQGGGHAWISIGWDLYYSAYWQYWSTAMWPRGSSSGQGAVVPWNSRSWDNGYSAWEGYWVWTGGGAFMEAWLYPGQPLGGPCTSNGPSASAFITP